MVRERERERCCEGHWLLSHLDKSSLVQLIFTLAYIVVRCRNLNSWIGQKMMVIIFHSCEQLLNEVSARQGVAVF